MSDGTLLITPDQLPILPEIQQIEPIVQCGVLYLGTALPSPGRRGLDSVQEPFAHRYPVDGINTVRGIDSVLSIYDNGIQLTFARQPHVVIFFPISSLIYCAALRFSIVENDQTSSLDWRFITLDSTTDTHSKHPPLFSIVVQRTQIISGDECHCFVTKSDDAALALVKTISEIYANLKPNVKPFKSPIFYQLDRYGRKISETNGIIYLSPANEDECQLNQSSDRASSIISMNQNFLLDPTNSGFFYRTDASLIEQWQLWDDDDLTGSRPRPPPSPFGQRQGLYHDDLTQELNQYLHNMNNEEHSSSHSSLSSSSSIGEYHSNRRHKHKSRYDPDSLNESFSNLQTSSFNPSLLVQNNMETMHNNNMKIQRSQQTPIIIEKVVPNPAITIPQNPPKYILEQPRLQPQPQQSLIQSIPSKQTSINFIPYSDSYEINERGERITRGGNRILFMDVIQPDKIKNKIEPQPFITPTPHPRPRPRPRQRPRSNRRRRSTHIPILDVRSFDSLLSHKKMKQRQTNISNNHEENVQDQLLQTKDLLEIVEGYFEDYKGRKIKLNGHDAQAMLEHLELSNEITSRQSNDSNNDRHRRRSRSMLTAGRSLHYVERDPSSQQIPIELQQRPVSVVYNTEPPNEYVSNVYGTFDDKHRSKESSLASSSRHEIQQITNMNTTNVVNENFISPYRYMQSSINRSLISGYNNIYGSI